MHCDPRPSRSTAGRACQVAERLDVDLDLTGVRVVARPPDLLRTPRSGRPATPCHAAARAALRRRERHRRCSAHIGRASRSRLSIRWTTHARDVDHVDQHDDAVGAREGRVRRPSAPSVTTSRSRNQGRQERRGRRPAMRVPRAVHVPPAPASSAHQQRRRRRNRSAAHSSAASGPRGDRLARLEAFDAGAADDVGARPGSRCRRAGGGCPAASRRGRSASSPGTR